MLCGVLYQLWFHLAMFVASIIAIENNKLTQIKYYEKPFDNFRQFSIFNKC